MKRLLAVSLSALSALAAACGPTGDDESLLYGLKIDAAPVVDAVRPDANPTEAGPDVPPAADLDGTFAVVARIHVKVLIDLYLKQYFLLALDQDGTRLHQKMTTCLIELPSFMNVVRITLPGAVLDLLRDRPVESEGEFLSTSGVGAKWRPDPTTVNLGFDGGDDPAGAPLPTMADLTSALDEDGDGHPGITADVMAATCMQLEHLYLALRTVIRFDGTVDSLDALSGTVEPMLEQAILGYSHECLRIAATLRIEVQPDSTFRAIRAPATLDTNADGAVTCDELRPALGELFPEVVD